ncbi:hypothetical protein LguiB_004268 [Lonicera macranthoides]
MAAKIVVFSLFLLSISSVALVNSGEDGFSKCMSTFQNKLYNTSSPHYTTLFLSSQQNTRWLNLNHRNPAFIFAPHRESQIRRAVLCCRAHGLQIRVKSGGHDYEGLSFQGRAPYVMLALDNFRAIKINLTEETAWVQTGATLGELYYKIAQKSSTHAFPAGTCPSVGTGGHISGGGFGMLARKYGLAADNVLDARLVDVNGRALNRKSMGEDLFWAIRGGGGASFGVITSWKLKLVRVPPVVTVCNVHRRLNESATRLVHQWQLIGEKLPKSILMRLFVRQETGAGAEKTIRVAFSSQFLGGAQDAVRLMEERFPQLGVNQRDCDELSWINATVQISSRGKTVDDLLNRADTLKTSYKAKTDFVSAPVPENILQGIWKRILKNGNLLIILDPFGGKISEIPESYLPFPHRNGILYNIQYIITWTANNASEARRSMRTIRELYAYMEPYVTSSPRTAYTNYRDLDIGMNKSNGMATYSRAKAWGIITSSRSTHTFSTLYVIRKQLETETTWHHHEHGITSTNLSFTSARTTTDIINFISCNCGQRLTVIAPSCIHVHIITRR